MQSKAATVAEYLDSLPEDRRSAIQAVRKVILDNLDPAYREGMQYGMIGFHVPHSLFPDGYHCDPSQPLPFACLASQKNYMSLYLMCAYGSEDGKETEMSAWFKSEWTKTGRKLDMGKSCIRFKRIEDVALDVVGQAIRRVPARDWIDLYVKVRDARKSSPSRRPSKPAAKPAAKAAKSAKKSPTSKTAAPKKAKAAGKPRSKR